MAVAVEQDKAMARRTGGDAGVCQWQPIRGLAAKLNREVRNGFVLVAPALQIRQRLLAVDP